MRIMTRKVGSRAEGVVEATTMQVSWALGRKLLTESTLSSLSTVRSLRKISRERRCDKGSQVRHGRNRWVVYSVSPQLEHLHLSSPQHATKARSVGEVG